MSPLPSLFQFTQTSLQDYCHCPRRFQLRYIMEQNWPAAPAEHLSDHEHSAELGHQFHRMMQRHAAGLPARYIAASAAQPELVHWWQNFLDAPPPGLPGPVQRAEITLTTPLEGYRLAAKFDLLAMEPGGGAVIVDWKTERRRPSRAELLARMQTRVYRYVLVQAGWALNHEPIYPDQVSMLYWFARFPDQPEILTYDSLQYARDARDLAGLIREIAGCDAPVFRRGNANGHCRMCLYGSLCEPGASAQDSDAEGELDWELESNEIEEIAY